MSRPLAFALEPSDVFLALLRLRAAGEAGRWPTSVSPRFATSLAREFGELEAAVRAIGVCYVELEARRVAVIDRAPQSRFADIDGALHLAACAIDVGLELDHVRVAVDRGDRAVRENGRLLASALRQLLWYTVHTDLLVCSRMMVGGSEVSPDRVLEYVDSYLAGAWASGAAPVPPPPGAIASEIHPARGPAHSTRDGATGFFSSATAHAVDLLGETGTTGAFDRLDLTSPETMLDPAPRRTSVVDLDVTTRVGDDDDDERRPAPDPAGPARGLSDDARFFLEASGLRWPCASGALHTARAALLARAPRDHRGSAAHDFALAWSDRVARGYDELRRLVDR